MGNPADAFMALKPSRPTMPEGGFAGPYDELDYLVRTYDKYYEMSDDHRYWVAGQARDKRMKELCAQLNIDFDELLKEIYE